MVRKTRRKVSKIKLRRKKFTIFSNVGLKKRTPFDVVAKDESTAVKKATREIFLRENISFRIERKKNKNGQKN